MSDDLVSFFAATSVFNLLLLVYLWIDARRRRIVAESVGQTDENGRYAVEHAKEMLLIDIRRREQLLDIRLKHLERCASIR